MISDPGAPGADFEDLTALSETLKINENQWFSNTFPSQSFKKQWKPMVFQYFSFPELQKAMETNGFPILFFPKASKSNENKWFSNTVAPQSLKK